MSSLILKLDLKVPTCRICLQNQHNGDEKMFPIFEEEIAEKIFRCTGIKVNKKQLNSNLYKKFIPLNQIILRFKIMRNYHRLYAEIV